MLSYHLRLGRSSSLFPSSFLTSQYAPNLSALRATCPIHLTLLYFITRTTFGEKYIS